MAGNYWANALRTEHQPAQGARRFRRRDGGGVAGRMW